MFLKLFWRTLYTKHSCKYNGFVSKPFVLQPNQCTKSLGFTQYSPNFAEINWILQNLETQTTTKNSLQAWLLLILLALIWGSSFILMKKSLVVYGVTEVAAGRLFCAFIFFLPIIFQNFRKIPTQRYPYLLVSALTGYVIPAFLFAQAGTRLNSSLSGMLNSLSPLCTLLLGVLFFGQSKRPLQMAGIVLGLLGSLLLIFSKNTGQLNMTDPYAFLILGATVLYGININVIVRYLGGLSAWVITAGTFIFIGPLMLLALLTTDFFAKMTQPANLQPTFFMLLLGVLGSGVASVLFNQIVRISSGLFASSVTYLIPIVAIFWGIFDSENITLQHYVGMAVILSGIYLVNAPNVNFDAKGLKFWKS
ncbi:MAG: DMT family transporter [Runella slithyformis]|jgi:drug/metabolite transporter (DMT)-like permease|nr:MAG: DMT family transporter [Runella slithyformis]TAF97736.1 MAG: DMT family transporter [Runella sp.]TAG24821.1 MAG: DMT family transporter [Cytophagales bacterium]TAG41857.1 MAG: DMT family transporter [Cytophagia bacterium]TAF27673.1 MAG: DMT family transporter [Runella slithyformis]